MVRRFETNLAVYNREGAGQGRPCAACPWGSCTCARARVRTRPPPAAAPLRGSAEARARSCRTALASLLKEHCLVDSGSDAVSQWLKEEGISAPLGAVLLVRTVHSQATLSARHAHAKVDVPKWLSPKVEA